MQASCVALHYVSELFQSVPRTDYLQISSPCFGTHSSTQYADLYFQQTPRHLHWNILKQSHNQHVQYYTHFIIHIPLLALLLHIFLSIPTNTDLVYYIIISSHLSYSNSFFSYCPYYHHNCVLIQHILQPYGIILNPKKASVSLSVSLWNAQSPPFQEIPNYHLRFSSFLISVKHFLKGGKGKLITSLHSQRI